MTRYFTGYKYLWSLFLAGLLSPRCSESHQHQPVQPATRQQQHEPLQQHPCPGLLWPVWRRSPTGWQRYLPGGPTTGHQPLRFLQGQHWWRWDMLLNTFFKWSEASLQEAIRNNLRAMFCTAQSLVIKYFSIRLNELSLCSHWERLSRSLTLI